MMQSNSTSESMIELTKEFAKSCDPYTKFLIDYYLEIEKQRMEFFKMAGPIFQGVVLPNLCNLAGTLENSNVDAFIHDSDIIQEVQLAVESANEIEVQTPEVIQTRGSITNLSFEVVTPKFLYPIGQAACELKVSEATLSLWCKIEKISYWPYRKLKSINKLIQIYKEIGVAEHEDRKDVDNAIKMLEEEKNSIMRDPNLPLKNSTLELRKKMHNKMNYIKKRKRITQNNDYSWHAGNVYRKVTEVFVDLELSEGKNQS